MSGVRAWIKWCRCNVRYFKGDVDCFLLVSVVSERMTKMLPFRWKVLPM